MADIFGRHPRRWPVSPEMGNTGSSEAFTEPPMFRHANVDIGEFGHNLRPMSMFEEDILQPLAELEADQTTQERAAVVGRLGRVSTNFSRPLVGQPNCHVAIDPIEGPRDDVELTHPIDSFPMPQRMGPGHDIGLPEFPQAQRPDQDSSFQNDVQSPHSSPIEHFLPIQSPSSAPNIGSRLITYETDDHTIGRKPSPQRTSPSKQHRYTPYPGPNPARLAKGSLEGLLRYRKLEKGELPPLPEIKRISGLMKSFEKFGLVGTPTTANHEHGVADSHTVGSNDRTEQTADDKSSTNPEGKQHFREHVSSAATKPEDQRFSYLCDNSFEQSESAPLADRAAVSNSYPQSLADTLITAPIITEEGDTTQIYEDTTSPHPRRRPPRPLPPPLPPHAPRCSFSVPSEPKSTQNFSPLTMEDTPPPNLRGEGYRYPAFERSQEHLSATASWGMFFRQ